MIEVKQFRANVRTWLLGISGMSTYTGSGSSARCFYGWPMQPPDWSLITFSLSRRPSHEYPFHGWEGQVEINLHDPNPETLDAMEDLIAEWLADAANSINDTLSTASKVTCVLFQLNEVRADEQSVSMEDGSYQFTTRPLVYDCAFVGLSEG